MKALNNVVGRWAKSSVVGFSKVGTSLSKAELACVAGGLPKGTWGPVAALPDAAWTDAKTSLPKGTW